MIFFYTTAWSSSRVDPPLFGKTTNINFNSKKRPKDAKEL